MRPQHVFLPRNSFVVSAVAALSVASVPAALGQAVVSYGVSVGRAAGAGAAAGTGAAGIFDKLSKTTASASKHEAKRQRQAKANSHAAPKSSTPNAITIVRKNSAADAGESSSLRTPSGITIAGLVGTSAANSRAPDRANQERPAQLFSEPSEFLRPAVPAPTPHPSEAATAVPAGAVAVQHEIEVSGATPATASEGEPALVIADGITPKAAPAAPPAAVPFTITPGTPIPDLFKLLGQPLMRLSGIEGSDYDERYVFLTASGSKLTIFARDGLVLSVIVDER